MIKITIGELTQTVYEWGYEYEIPTNTIYNRIKKGMQGEDLLAMPKDKLDKDYVHKLWGGKWTYTGRKRIPKWKYVGVKA